MHEQMTLLDYARMVCEQYESGLISEWEMAQALIQAAEQVPEPASGTIDPNTGLRKP